MKAVAYKGRVISVRSEKHRFPNGIEARLDVVRHPGAVLILPFLSPTKIILLYQYRPVIRKYILELPAGTIDQKESPLACAKRELIEETGFKAAQFKKLGTIYPVPGYSTELITLFQASCLSRDFRPKDQDELINVRPYTIDAVKRLFRQGQIIDAKTICALSFSGLLR